MTSTVEKGRKRNPAVTLDQATLKWSYEGFREVCTRVALLPEYEAEFPERKSTVRDVPSGKIAVYADFFTTGNLRFPITRFLGAVFRGYNIHLSQMSPLGLVRITHFEYCCRTRDISPSFDMFNVFYKLTLKDGWYSFCRRNGVGSIITDALKSLHDWKHKFFFIRQDVIPFRMQYRADGVCPDFDLITFEGTSWYRTLTETRTALQAIPEPLLVRAGMSRLWNFEDAVPIFVECGQGKLSCFLCLIWFVF